MIGSLPKWRLPGLAAESEHPPPKRGIGGPEPRALGPPGSSVPQTVDRASLVSSVVMLS